MTLKLKVLAVCLAAAASSGSAAIQVSERADVVLAAVAPGISVLRVSGEPRATGSGPMAGSSGSGNSIRRDLSSDAERHVPATVLAFPEPGRWAVLLAGLLGVGAIARRRMSS